MKALRVNGVPRDRSDMKSQVLLSILITIYNVTLISGNLAPLDYCVGPPHPSRQRVTSSTFTINLDKYITMIGETERMKKLWKAVRKDIPSQHAVLETWVRTRDIGQPYFPVDTMNSVYVYGNQLKLHCFESPLTLLARLVLVKELEPDSALARYRPDPRPNNGQGPSGWNEQVQESPGQTDDVQGGGPDTQPQPSNPNIIQHLPNQGQTLPGRQQLGSFQGASSQIMTNPGLIGQVIQAQRQFLGYEGSEGRSSSMQRLAEILHPLPPQAGLDHGPASQRQQLPQRWVPNEAIIQRLQMQREPNQQVLVPSAQRGLPELRPANDDRRSETDLESCDDEDDEIETINSPHRRNYREPWSPILEEEEVASPLLSAAPPFEFKMYEDMSIQQPNPLLGGPNSYNDLSGNSNAVQDEDYGNSPFWETSPVPSPRLREAWQAPDRDQKWPFSGSTESVKNQDEFSVSEMQLESGDKVQVATQNLNMHPFLTENFSPHKQGKTENKIEIEDDPVTDQNFQPRFQKRNDRSDSGEELGEEISVPSNEQQDGQQRGFSISQGDEAYIPGAKRIEIQIPPPVQQKPPLFQFIETTPADRLRMHVNDFIKACLQLRDSFDWLWIEDKPSKKISLDKLILYHTINLSNWDIVVKSLNDCVRQNMFREKIMEGREFQLYCNTLNALELPADENGRWPGSDLRPQV